MSEQGINIAVHQFNNFTVSIDGEEIDGIEDIKGLSQRMTYDKPQRYNAVGAIQDYFPGRVTLVRHASQCGKLQTMISTRESMAKPRPVTVRLLDSVTKAVKRTFTMTNCHLCDWIVETVDMGPHVPHQLMEYLILQPETLTIS